jgi:hypothetical protein
MRGLGLAFFGKNMISLTLPNGVVTLELRHELVLQDSSPSNNTIKGMHPQVYKKLRNAWKQKVVAAVGTAPDTPIDKAFLIIERYCAGSGLDWDNAYGGLKPILDCLVRPSARNPDGLGIIEDDNPANMPFPPYLIQKPAKMKQGRIIIKVYEIISIAQAVS